VKAVAPAPSPQFDPDKLIRLSVAADMVGISSDDMRRVYAIAHGLTIIDQSRPGAQRSRLFMILGEVVAHRRKLIDNARERTNVLRLVKNGTDA
jgi:hypothetical protein